MTRSGRWGWFSQRSITRAGTLMGGTTLATLVVACAGPEWVPPPGSIPDPPPPMVAVAPTPQVTVASAPKRPAPDATEEELVEQDRHHHHGGVTMFIAMALDTLAVAPAERADVLKVQGVLEDWMAAAQDAERGVIATLADGVQAGSLDPKKVDAAIAKLAKASGLIHAGTVASLVKLHGILSPLERSTLADKVQAHWTVWGRANGGAAHESPIVEMTDLLALSPDQVAKIRAAEAALPATTSLDTKDVDAHIHAFETAFAGAALTPKAIPLAASDDTRLATAGAAYTARFCEAATPVLTPEQRTKLAAHLREHLDHSDAPAGS